MVPRVIRLSRGAQPQSKVLLPKGPPMGKFCQKTLRSFHSISDFWIKIVKMMKPGIALGLTLNILRFYPGVSLTVLNPDFSRVIQKFVETCFLMPCCSLASLLAERGEAGEGGRREEGREGGCREEGPASSPSLPGFSSFLRLL